MKPPAWFREKIATFGDQAIAGSTTEGKAVAAVTTYITTEHPDYATRIVAEFVRKHLRTWTTQHGHGSDGSAGDRQGDLFPEIPRRLETSPGRFADQAVMTRKDWRNAVKQSRTKANNAGGHADAIKTVADLVLPLYENDEETTAEVMARAGLLATAGGA